MKLFQTVQKHYAALGISPSNRLAPKNPISGGVFFGFLLFGCSAVSQFVYIFRVANGLIEYMECAGSISGGIIIFVCFLPVVLRKATLFKSIDSMEKLIDTSEPSSKPFRII